MDAKKTILIIEDEPHIVLGLEDALTFEGFRVVSAGTGKEGGQLARQEKPNAILLDLMLPDVNGYLAEAECPDGPCSHLLSDHGHPSRNEIQARLGRSVPGW